MIAEKAERNKKLKWLITTESEKSKKHEEKIYML